jgi:hypothetical protein
MRLVLLLCVAACQSPFATKDMLGGGGGGGGGSGSGSGGIPTECSVDGECVLAAAKCCDCPAFAVPTTDPAHKACAGITCPPSSCPMNVQAVCTAGACTLACVPIAVTQSCPGGYALDPTGCLEDACADIPQPQCSVDNDCVRTRADCCGCSRGGTDTAVPALDQAAFDSGLNCPSNPACPMTDTCAPNLLPRCIEGRCELTTTTPANSCTGTCATGTCTINVDATATMQGLGVCM